MVCCPHPAMGGTHRRFRSTAPNPSGLRVGQRPRPDQRRSKPLHPSPLRRAVAIAHASRNALANPALRIRSRSRCVLARTPMRRPAMPAHPRRGALLVLVRQGSISPASATSGSSEAPGEGGAGGAGKTGASCRSGRQSGTVPLRSRYDPPRRTGEGPASRRVIPLARPRLALHCCQHMLHASLRAPDPRCLALASDIA